MANVAVIGAQWGDEGKGKMVDWLSSRADVVVRFQGGHNAGHTLVIDGVEFKLSLLPSGIVRPGKLAIIGNGVVLDPGALLEEIDRIAAKGVRVSPDNLLIAENVPLILPLHQAIDRTHEAARGAGRIGTTGRGIGPAYEDKVARRAVRLADLDDDGLLAQKVERLVEHHNHLLRGLGGEVQDARENLDHLLALRDRVLPYSGVCWQALDMAAAKGQRILFEGAQGAMLDIDHGTYPYVTSSSTLTGHAPGAGVGPGQIHEVLGIAKAYCTRVGMGPFPTEQANDIGERIGARGREFGTVTGRKRRCGWFDAVLVRQAVKTGGITGLALTKLDVLDGMETLRICTGYRLDGEIIHHLPAGQADQARVKPVYEEMPGWSETTAATRKLDALPATARAYLDRLAELVEAPLALISTSPERDDTILLRDPFGT